MKFTTLSRRTAAAGAASALVAGALVGATTTVAEAAPVTNTYVCGIDGLAGPWDVTVVSDIPDAAALPQVPAGVAAPAGFSVLNAFTIPDEAYDALGAFGVTNVSFPDYAGSVGNTSVGVDGMGERVANMTDNSDGTHSFDANGTTQAFKAPAAGTYDLLSPTAFNMNANNDDGTIAPVPCALKGGTTAGAYQQIVVVKNDSTTAAKAVNAPVKKGAVAKVKVKVSGPDFQTPRGKVLLKKGKKTVAKGNLNKRGVVVLKTRSLPRGKNKLTALYKGDGYTNKSKDGVVVKVVR